MLLIEPPAVMIPDDAGISVDIWGAESGQMGRVTQQSAALLGADGAKGRRN